ncbi:MAG: hypothetical protein FJ265_18745 [Planctomycetes bacterium]|nr:hypothetical protein [Planctomycetota bacterium]
MQILVTFQDRRPSEQIAYVARRTVEHALDRFASRIRDITVKIRDDNADRGGEDQVCSLALRVVGGGELHLHDRDSRPEPAIHRLARRAARMVAGLARRRGRSTRR